MTYNIGDRFLVQDCEGVVLFENAGMAWLFPINLQQEGVVFEGNSLILGLAFAKLDSDRNVMGVSTKITAKPVKRKKVLDS